VTLAASGHAATSGMLSLCVVTWFCLQAEDGVLLEGRLSEYRQLFERCPSWEADSSGLGTIDRACVLSLGGRLEHPFTIEEAESALNEFCDDRGCKVEDERLTFADFLNMFHDKMLDLQQITEYMKLEEVPQPSYSPSEVLILCLCLKCVWVCNRAARMIAAFGCNTSGDSGMLCTPATCLWLMCLHYAWLHRLPSRSNPNKPAVFMHDMEWSKLRICAVYWTASPCTSPRVSQKDSGQQTSRQMQKGHKCQLATT
jgi:hypothetical protein